MKISFPAIVPLFALCVFVTGNTHAQDYYASSSDASLDIVSQDEVVQAQPIQPVEPTVEANGLTTMSIPSLTTTAGWQLETELLFLRFHKATGTQVNNTIGGVGPDPGARGLGVYQTGFEASPRISISYVASNNVFTKIRWFDYQHSAKNIVPGPNAAGTFGGASIDAYSLDFVAGERFYLGRGWDVELEGGLRHIGYEEHRQDVVTVLSRRHDVSWGTGAIVGLEARKQIRGNTSVFGRFRTAIVQGGHRHWNDVTGVQAGRYHTNITSMQIEIATGTEWNWILDNGNEVFVRTTGEAIQWSDLSTDDAMLGDISDIGWGGFGFVFGIYR